LRDGQHVIERGAVDGEQRDGLVRGEGAKRLRVRSRCRCWEAECPCETEVAFGKKMVGWSERPVLYDSFQTSTSPSLPATYSMVRSVERNATTFVKLPRRAEAACSLPIAAM